MAAGPSVLEQADQVCSPLASGGLGAEGEERRRW